MLTWRADDVHARRRRWIPRHDRNKCAGGQIFTGNAIGEPSDAEACCCGGNERCAIVGLEAPLRTNREDLIAVITDASGGISKESHEVAVQRMIAAGANPMTVMALAGEWQRDWARTEHVEELTEILIQHFSDSGIAYLWEQQLLNTPVAG